MLHELLLALRGHPGLLFSNKFNQNENIKNKFQVNTTLPFLHPCEVALLNQVLEVACDYSTVTTFISLFQTGSGGMYLESVCHGLDKVLDTYRSALSDLEREMLLSGDLPSLSLVQHRLMSHRQVIRSLVTLVECLEKCTGCMVLDVVYKASTSGVERVGIALRKVLAEGNKVLYKQLLAWLLQGELYDPHKEFFIVQEEGEGESILVGDVEEVSKSRRYRLEIGNVPGHISHRLAEKIFFIGESIQLFESDRRVEVQGAVIKEREEEFYSSLAKLRDSEEFVVGEFARFVDKVRESVSSHLLKLVMEESSLLAELRQVWDMFLLGRGELFHALISAADVCLSKSPTNSTQHDTRQCWLTALALHETEESIVAKVTPLVGKESGSCGWDQLSLQYLVPWPLHLVVGPSVLDKYNAVFSFLMLVRRTQMALHRAWAGYMFNSRGNRGSGDKGDQTRTHMTFLVDNLQYYLVSDVLETQTASLVVKLTNSTCFEDIRRYHDQFLSGVESSVFLHNPKVSQCLKVLMSTCLQYCQSPSPELINTFNLQSSLLLRLLTSLRHHLASSNLTQLLTRIDYNRFFSKKEKTNVRTIV